MVRYPNTCTLHFYPTTGATYSRGDYVAATANTIRVQCRIEKQLASFKQTSAGRIVPYDYIIYMEPQKVGKSAKRMIQFYDKELPILDIIEYGSHWEVLT